MVICQLVREKNRDSGQTDDVDFLLARLFLFGFLRYFFPRPQFDYDGSDWEAQEHFKSGVMYLEMAEVEEQHMNKEENDVKNRT